MSVDQNIHLQVVFSTIYPPMTGPTHASDVQLQVQYEDCAYQLSAPTKHQHAWNQALLV